LRSYQSKKNKVSTEKELGNRREELTAMVRVAANGGAGAKRFLEMIEFDGLERALDEERCCVS
jgi:hypothetical protein